MAKATKKVAATFYATEGGNEPVRKWLLDMSYEDRRVIGSDIATVEFGWPIGMPTCRPMGTGLFEIRSNISDGRIARILFAFHGDEIILLHAFVKKTQATSKEDIDLARRRMGDHR